MDVRAELRLLSEELFLPEQDYMSVNYLSIPPASHLMATVHCNLITLEPS